MKSSVSARLVERADKRRGMTLLELRAFIASCEEQGIPDHATLRVNVGMRRQLQEIVATVADPDPGGIEHETQQLLERAPRTWVLAGTLTEAEQGCAHRSIAYVQGMPIGTRVCAVTSRSEDRMRGVSVRTGDKLLQLPGTHQSTIAAFETAMTPTGVTYADLEILL